MVKKEEGQAGDFGQKITGEPEPEPVVTEPTPEQQMETLQTQIKELSERAEKAEKSSQGLRGSLKEKDDKIREQASSQSRMDGLEERMEIIATLLDKRLTSGGLDDEEKVDLRKEFATLKERQAQEREREKVTLQQQEDFRHRNELWEKAQEFGTYQDNDAVAEIYDALADGKVYKAERIIKKLEGANPKGDKVESDEETRQKWIEEGKRLGMEEKGLLKSDVGGPAGEATNEEKIKQNFRKNPTTDKAARDAYLELLAKKGRGS